ncbi:MAG TPA: hypothetical protein VHM91_20705 [Verrucomicrobiales bacterium]|jgi:hypothetical protein|nr:hypothetical protein [Verrucomicrobiales bacterium]
MNRLSVVGLLVLMTGLRPATADPAPAEAAQVQALTILRADIAAKPSRVLIAVEDALTMSEQSACEIIKAAIEATRADTKLVGEIVFTALKNAPGMAATIVECALSTNPEAASQISEAAKRALGEKAVAVPAAQTTEKTAATAQNQPTGKESGKGGADVVSEDSYPDDAFFSWVGVGGIYLLTPARGTLHLCDPLHPCCNDDLSRACLRP